MTETYSIKERIRPEEVLIYLRKSRADDPTLTVEEVLSKHETLLNEWVERNLIAPIPPENRFKEVVSGESIADRPEFQKVLKLIESPKYKAVLVVEISRLGRPDMEEIGKISKMFRYTNTLVITPSRTFNVADRYERDMFEQELKIGNFYLEYVKGILKRGREESAKRGCFLTGRPPYGYDKTTVIEGKRKYPTLVINEEKASVVRMIYNAYVNENVGSQVIANRINDMGITPPLGKSWSRDTIRDILENPHYIGKVKWNWRKEVLVVDDGKFRKTRSTTREDERILSEGLHESIISDELFYAAQTKRGRSHRTQAAKELRNPFAGILFCECGRAMSCRITVGKGRVCKRTARLICNDQLHCGNASCSLDEMTDFVVNLLEQKITEYKEEVGNESSETTKLYETQVTNLEKKLNNINNKELSLWEAQLDSENKMPTTVFQALTDKLLKEREETETALAKAREMLATPITNEVKLVTLQTALNALLDDEVNVREKNKFLKTCFERIIYRREPLERKSGKGQGIGFNYPPMVLDVEMLF